MSDNTSLPDQPPQFIDLQLVPTLNGQPISITGEPIDHVQNALSQQVTQCQHRFNIINLHREVVEKNGLREWVYLNFCLECLTVVERYRERIDT